MKFQITQQRAGQTLHATWDNTTITITDPTTGEVITHHTWPDNGITYVSNGIPRGRPKKT